MNQAINPIKRRTIVLILFFAIPLLICHGKDKKIKLHKNAKAMRQEIAKQIPIGSTIKDAQRIMEVNGFKCLLRERRTFAEMNDDDPVIEHEDIDFLYCDKEKGIWWPPFCERRWQVAIVHKDSIVLDIFVSISLTCT